MKFLLDANVVSELRKRHPDARVSHWISGQRTDRLGVSVANPWT